jgi:membrane-bound metal-dependent hydrolase YbcI (DUF457 family)
MFAVGHLSLGYLVAKGSAKLLKTDINLPLVFTLSLIPDIDILIPFVQHRTITHSLILTLIACLPFLLAYRTKALPYVAALAQHTLIGDVLTGGYQGFPLFWPITSAAYGLPLDVSSPANIALEWASFVAAMIVMFKTRDLHRLLKHKVAHVALFIPISTVLLPAFFRYPMGVPPSLILPHLAYLTLFALSIFTALARAVTPKPNV